MEQKTVTTVSPDNIRSSRPDMFLKTAVMKNSRQFRRNRAWWSASNFLDFFQSSYSNISGWQLLWIVKCPEDNQCRIFHLSLQNLYTLKRLTFFHPLINSLLKHPLINLQPRTKLVEKKVENLVNSRNDSIFQIPNSPPYPPISMLNMVEICCQKPKTLSTTLIRGDRVFFTEK